jgi:hypothetical protein
LADYTTLLKVKDRLVDLQGDTTYDTLLGDLITSCSREVDRLTQSQFDLSSGIVRLFDGKGTKVLILPKPGFQTVSQLRIKVGGESGTWTVVSSSDYYLDPATRPAGEPARWITLAASPASVSRFDTGKRTVEVTGDQGWATIPPEIATVVLEEVVQSWRSRGGQRDDPGPTGTSPAPTAWLFSRRSLSVLETYGYRAPSFA